VALGLLLGACEAAGTSPPQDGSATIVIEEEQPEPEPPEADEQPEQGAHAPPEPEDEPTSSSRPEPSAPREEPASPEPRERPDDQGVEGGAAAVPDDAGPLGSACRAYLRDDIPALTIEVVHHAGAAPHPDAVDHLVGSLAEVVDKPGGVELAGPREVPGTARTWTLDELRAAAVEHRRVRSGQDRMGMLVLSVAGEFEREGVLGVAVSATEMVLFPDNVGDLATSLLGGRRAIERSVLLHEAGHLLCLVNLTYESAIDHEDPDRPHHSRHRDSVMHWAVPNDAVTQVFTGPPPDAFHADDLADLEGLRAGRH
jgi:hypothetical protein